MTTRRISNGMNYITTRRPLSIVWDFLKRRKHITTWIFFGIEGVVLYIYFQTGIDALLLLGMIVAIIILVYVEIQF